MKMFDVSAPFLTLSLDELCHYAKPLTPTTTTTTSPSFARTSGQGTTDPVMNRFYWLKPSPYCLPFSRLSLRRHGIHNPVEKCAYMNVLITTAGTTGQLLQLCVFRHCEDGIVIENGLMAARYREVWNASPVYTPLRPLDKPNDNASKEHGFVSIIRKYHCQPAGFWLCKTTQRNVL